MTKLLLVEKIKEYKEGKIDGMSILDAVDEFERALLQQANVLSCEAIIEQMAKDENEALGKAIKEDDLYNRERHANRKYCLAIVLQMLREHQPAS